ncbi:hypothetical protein ETD83_31990 [Actinomadura soli]|uniref:Uncharacterized protein n=1 Tax=Actinomadura soli TaxID=2508997 RepID=A0A5C4J4B3_9ACTN|nr:hypothetical protein [Actinomadura soli]TMQ91211.1 hypothetical protein ETD83_31990 [Actinomadura soli]
MLADGEPLSVSRILRQAGDRDIDETGGLVVLAVCTSGLDERRRALEDLGAPGQRLRVGR